jgi:large subunit ribosomal protein L30e
MTDDIRNAIKENSILIGSKQTMKGLKQKSIKSVVVASNCPEGMKKDLERLSAESSIRLEVFDGTAKQLGVLCGKPFSISVMAIK